jgi:hypothetical protein
MPRCVIRLRKVTDTINELVRSLTSFSVPVDEWDIILVFMAMRKLDVETKEEWLLNQGNNLPVLQEFIDFLESRARALADALPNKKSSKSDDKR